MSAAARRTWIAAYLAAVLAVCLYLGFPSEALRAHVAHRLAAGVPGLSVAVNDIRPALPPGLELKGVRIARTGVDLLQMERLRIAPEWLTLVREITRYRFEGSAAAGEISGTAEVQGRGEQPLVAMQAQWSGVLLERLPALQEVYGSRLSGRLEGTLAFSGQGSLSGRIRVADAQVDLARPLFDQKSFGFRSVDAEVGLQERTLLLRNGRLRGNEVDAEVSGTIALGSSAGAGALNLTGRISPHHAFMARIEGSLPAALMRRRAAIPFKITGSLEAPAVSLN
jgi:type II secretion system protein N